MMIVLVIGKVVLILLLIMICILAAILFFPVSYELDLDIDNKQVSARINWLFRLVRFRFRMKERMEAALSIFFFKMDFTDPEFKRKRAVRKSKKLIRKQKKLQKQDKKSEKAANENSLQDSDLGEEEKTADFSGEETDSGETVSRESKENGSGIEASVRRLLEAAGNALGYVGVFRRILGLVREYEVISIVWPRLGRFLFRIRPRKIRGQILFGLEDPASTGQLTGAIAVLPFFYGTELRISPDFEADETYIRGAVYIKGHMLLIHVLIFLVGLVREKKIRLFIKAIRKRK